MPSSLITHREKDESFPVYVPLFTIEVKGEGGVIDLSCYEKTFVFIYS